MSSDQVSEPSSVNVLKSSEDTWFSTTSTLTVSVLLPSFVVTVILTVPNWLPVIVPSLVIVAIESLSPDQTTVLSVAVLGNTVQVNFLDLFIWTVIGVLSIETLWTYTAPPVFCSKAVNLEIISFCFEVKTFIVFSCSKILLDSNDISSDFISPLAFIQKCLVLTPADVILDTSIGFWK